MQSKDSLKWLNGTDLLNVHVLDVHAIIETEYHKLSYLVPSETERCLPEAAARPLSLSLRPARLAILTGRCQDEEEKGRLLVKRLHDPHHVFVLCVGVNSREPLDQWIKEQRWSNVFVIAKYEHQKRYEEMRLEVTQLLLENHQWDYLLDLEATSISEFVLPTPLLARWFTAINGSYVDRLGQSLALRRQHVEEVLEGIEDKLNVKWKKSSGWIGFWKEVLFEGQCFLRSQEILPTMKPSKGKKRLSAKQLDVSPTAAYDAGVKFLSLDADWTSTYEDLSFWLLHTLLVQGFQHRLSSLRNFTRREPSPSWTLRSEQYRAEVTFRPDGGLCEIPSLQGNAGGLQLTDCSVDAEVFLVERLFVADPYWKTPTPSGSTKLSSCPASFPYVFRVGTAWNGDLWSFSGFTSLVPSSATSDLWMVLLPLFQEQWRFNGKTAMVLSTLEVEVS
eukprot:symbB.v1.2.002553.t3/scaffold136.1/size304296/6